MKTYLCLNIVPLEYFVKKSSKSVNLFSILVFYKQLRFYVQLS